MKASHHEVGIEKVDEKIQKPEANLAQMDRQENLYKLKNFYDHMDSNQDQHLTITKTSIELIGLSGCSVSTLTKRLLHRKTRYKDDAMVYYREDNQIHSKYHRFRYVTTLVH